MSLIKDCKTIVWDWNGTLLDDVLLSVDSINFMLRDRGLHELTLERYKTIFDFPVKKYYEVSGFDFGKEPFEKPAAQFMELYRAKQKETSLFPDVRETLSFIKDNGYQQITLSAMEDGLLKKMLTDFNIYNYFDAVYGIKDDFATEKISIGKNMIKRLKINPKQCLMIGDTLHDAEVAEECGFNCILFSGGHVSRERLETKKLPIIDRIGEIKNILTK